QVLVENNGINWCICLKDASKEHVGTIGLWRIEKENYRAEIGYMLEPRLHGKGIMYEAMKAVLNYGFNMVGLHSVEAKLDPRNSASAALLKKAKFIQEGYFKENCRLGNDVADTAVYSLLTPLKAD